MGHTMSIHSQNDQVILEFGLHKPAFRIIVNSPTTHGSVGLSTGLDPAMTLGCGGFGGNITSDNISPRHLLNIKRVAYEVTPTVSRWDRQGLAVGAKPRLGPAADTQVRPYALPEVPAKPPAPTGISADALSRRIDQFLGSRGFKAETGDPKRVALRDPRTVALHDPRTVALHAPGTAALHAPGTAALHAPGTAALHADAGASDAGRPFQDRQGNAADSAPLDFVCEEDVRLAIQAGRKLVVSERAIVTPAARDLGEAHRVLSVAPWRG
jgi:acetaldehyde dehydrogenase (acetylating)